MKNEAEAYMLKELSLLKWQEKATKLAAEENSAKMVELQTKLSSLEENIKSKRYFSCLRFIHILTAQVVHIQDIMKFPLQRGDQGK